MTALSAQRPSPTTPTVDFEVEGVQHGDLRPSWSGDDLARAAVAIPFTVVKRDAGPIARLTGANHGDEYQGPIRQLAARHFPGLAKAGDCLAVVATVEDHA